MQEHPFRDALWNLFRDDWKWILTAFLAVWGAGLSTYREIVTRRAARVRIEVKLFPTMIVLDGPKSTPYIQVRIEHHGGPSVYFNDNCCQLVVPGIETRLLFWEKKLTDIKSWPHEMKPGTTFYVMITRKEAVEGLESIAKKKIDDIDVQAVVSTALLKEFSSKKIRFPPAPKT